MNTERKKIAVIGGGPAGIAATYDSAKRRLPVKCFEADTTVGGISRTIEYKGFRFDIGGHRFFTKNQRVMDLWHEVLGDEFLKRPRLSRVYYNGKFFDYPLQPLNALGGLGLLISFMILTSYLKVQLFPLDREETFEQWVTNRFGAELYNIFFKTYTEKVWGIPCADIRAEWAAQRIKGLSLGAAIINALGYQNKSVKTLINEFHYPRLGPGQMYETMAQKAIQLGADVLLGHRVVAVEHDGNCVKAIKIKSRSAEFFETATDFISTMPITELVLAMRPKPPADVIEAAQALRYRSLVTINLLLDRPEQLSDTWIYVHDPDVKMGRVQFFANWSPDMVPSEEYSSMGLEYFCWQGDELWSMRNEDLLELGKEEIKRLGLADPAQVMDGFVVRMPKCYPVYDEAYQDRIDILRKYLSGFHNLQLCGRYGLFKYNNMDHSMLTALHAVENILGANHDVWAINADDEHHEEGRYH